MIENPDRFDLGSYFLGFWIADGSYAKGRLRFLISHRDRAILDLFHAHYGGTRSEYVYNNGISYYSVPVSVVSELMQRANITSDKRTAERGQIRFQGETEFCSFLLGFIDGDGSVSAPSFHRSTRISMIAHSRELLECLCVGAIGFTGAKGRLVVSKGKYYQLVYSRDAVSTLAHKLSPYLLQSFRKHRLIADIVANYDYDRAKVFHSKLDKAAHDEMVVLRQQGLSYGEIARRYEVSKQSVMAVVKRRL